MKGIYLAAYQAYHSNYSIVYQDINGKRDIAGDMMDIDLTNYDFIIASPPCNWWSRANYRRNVCSYSLKTKHLLPDILKKLIKCDKPWIVENVRSSKLFAQYGLFDLPCFIYFIGRHTYWTNVLMSSDLMQVNDNIKFIASNKRQGGSNVHTVIDYWLSIISI